MSLQLITGNSGSGKSETLFRKIIEESMIHPEKNYMVIVPEQFTMQTQKELVRLHPNHGIMNIDVLSFPRLAHRIFEETGEDRRTILTETGKNLMIRRLSIGLEEELPVLGSRMNRTGYVAKVKSMLSELMQYEVTAEDLEDLIAQVKDRPLLAGKLQDVKKLYQAFLEEQKEKFMKPEELLDVLCRAAERSALLRRSVLAFDCFTGFTPSQLNVLERLMCLCPQIYITVTIAAGEDWTGQIEEHELFALSKKTIRTILDTARAAMSRSETSFEIQEPLVLGAAGCPRFRMGGELEHLEKNLFRTRRKVYKEGDGAAVPELSFHTAANPSGEVAFAAREISRLVKENGYRYRDIAIITGNLSSYDSYIRKIFPKYRIPVFIDQTRHVLLNPCLEFIRSALEMAEKDYSAEAVIRYLRTGMADMTLEETDLLENYLLKTGIRGRRQWEQSWCMLPEEKPDAMMQKDPEGKRIDPPEERQLSLFDFLSEEELMGSVSKGNAENAYSEEEQCELFRRKIIRQTGDFAEILQKPKASMQEYTEALYRLMADCQLQQKLSDQEVGFLNSGAADQAKEYSQIYGIVLKLLDEMSELLGTEEVSGKEFSDILEAGFAEAKVGIIPPGIDEVQVGDIERTRLSHVKHLFFLGLNDGWVPSHGDDSGIVSDMEREVLRERGADLAPTGREEGYIQRFYLYQNLTKPEDHLYLSWCRSGSDGSMMRPSYLVSVLRKLFPELPVSDEELVLHTVRQVTAPENGMEYLTEGLRMAREGRETREWRELFRTCLQDENLRERIEYLTRAAFLRGEAVRLTYTTSRDLYGEVLRNSVTRLEQFASCAFAHFAAYGLGLKERETYGIRPADLGTLFHRSMELFSRELDADPRYDWLSIPEEERCRKMEQCVDQITLEYGGSVLHSSARNEYTIRRIKRILNRTTWALHRQLQAGNYTPKGFEVSFSEAEGSEAVTVRLAGGEEMRLQGRIDRIDTYETDQSVYIKIVDYKSGTTKFDPVSLYYGLQLQLLVYLNTALELEKRRSKGKETVPAGIFYYHLDDPVLEKEKQMTEELIPEKLLKKLKPDGIVNSDREILETLDRGIGAESSFIPAAFKKDGSLKAGSSAISTEEFGAVSGFVQKKLKESGQRILDGEIAAFPVRSGQRFACDFCDYADVCAFDRKLPGTCEHRLPALEKEKAWEKIVEEGKAYEASRLQYTDKGEKSHGINGTEGKEADA